MSKIYFDTPYVTIWLDETIKTGGAIWNGQLTTEQYRDAFTKCFKLIADKNLENWLGDNRKMQAISAEDQEWTLQILPSVMPSSLKKMATLVAEDIFLQMTVVTLFDVSNGQLTFQNKFFPNLEAATEWLEISYNLVKEAYADQVA
jgi:hypothetical protein